jgi:ferritin-like metal-binding protein YciE
MRKSTTANGRGSNGKASVSSAAKRASSNGHSNHKAGTSAKQKSKASSPSHKEGLEKVMKDTLKDIFYAEKQLVKALGKMEKAADSEELKQAFKQHKQETEEQVSMLEDAFESLGMRAAGKKCPAMDGLVEEGSEAMEEYDKGPARDAALIVSAQKVEHYEMAAYGSLRAFAATLGYTDCEKIFDSILDQESNADDILTQVAASVNEAAAAGEQVEEEEMEEA